MGETRSNCPINVGSLKVLTRMTALMMASGMCSVQSNGRVADGNWRQFRKNNRENESIPWANYPTFIEVENSSTPFL